MVGEREGVEWFGVSTTLGLHLPVASWSELTARADVARAAGEWVTAVDPSSGDA